MQFKYLRGACLIIEGGNKRVLCDPWLEDSIYYGSWAHYPPYVWRDDLSTLDYIYVSHIHPDHFDPQTMKRLPKVPVLIHKFKSKFLKKNIEACGFEVRELENNYEHDLGGLKINIIAADNCNPAICMKFFGCDATMVGDTQIDSLAVFTDGKQTYVNANDCPYLLSRSILPMIRKQYPEIDMLFVAYAGAGPYPQCFEMPEHMKVRYARMKKESFLKHAGLFARDLKARHTFPFAGDYALCGRFADMNRHRGVATLAEVYRHFEEQNIPVVRMEVDDVDGRERYVTDVLAKRSMDYERDRVPESDELAKLMREAWQRLELKRKEIGLNTGTVVYIPLGDETLMRIPFNGTGISRQKRIYDAKYVKMSLDPRALYGVLSGPKTGYHWNNLEIGSHIQYQRMPIELFERGIYHCLSFFHV